MCSDKCITCVFQYLYIKFLIKLANLKPLINKTLRSKYMVAGSQHFYYINTA